MVLQCVQKPNQSPETQPKKKMAKVGKNQISQWRLNIQQDSADFDIKEKLSHAMRLRSRGYSQEDAAKTAHVTRQQIRRFVKTKELIVYFFPPSLLTLICRAVFVLLQRHCSPGSGSFACSKVRSTSQGVSRDLEIR